MLNQPQTQMYIFEFSDHVMKKYSLSRYGIITIRHHGKLERHSHLLRYGCLQMSFLSIAYYCWHLHDAGVTCLKDRHNASPKPPSDEKIAFMRMIADDLSGRYTHD